MIRFGAQLDIWLDFLGLRQQELAEATKLKPTYISSLIRGLEQGGIDKPGDANQKKIFRSLAAKWGKKVDRDIFWQGPPAFNTPSSLRSTNRTNELVEILRSSTYDGKPLSPAEQTEILDYAAFVRSKRSQSGRP